MHFEKFAGLSRREVLLDGYGKAEKVMEIVVRIRFKVETDLGLIYSLSSQYRASFILKVSALAQFTRLG
jgi:hypothetical protein